MDADPRFEPKKLFRYPHMFPLDIAIWERFIDIHGSEFAGFDYDVKVGSGTEPPAGVGDNYARMQTILSKYRIDVVGHKGNELWIIEVKPEAGTVAIGQIEAYTNLYKRDYNPTKKIVGCIVTDRILPDMEYLTKLKGIEYYVV
jgi:hypothetical protein